MATGSSSPRSFPAPELERAVGSAPVDHEPVTGGGYGTNTARWRVRLADGRTAFVKLALDDVAVAWLRDEHRVYAGVEAPFMPRLLGWDDEERTLLVLEDLSDAYWPPPWAAAQIDDVLAVLDEVHATAAPARLPTLEEERPRLDGWPEVEADLEPFLSTGLASREWLEAALPALLAASAACELRASRAGRPPPETAPRVRDFQRRQGEVAARELALDAPG